MTHDEKTAVADSSPPSTRVEPPKIYLAACGALCDIFWWARRDGSGEEQGAAPVSADEKQSKMKTDIP